MFTFFTFVDLGLVRLNLLHASSAVSSTAVSSIAVSSTLGLSKPVSSTNHFLVKKLLTFHF